MLKFRSKHKSQAKRWQIRCPVSFSFNMLHRPHPEGESLKIQAFMTTKTLSSNTTQREKPMRAARFAEIMLPFPAPAASVALRSATARDRRHAACSQRRFGVPFSCSFVRSPLSGPGEGIIPSSNHVGIIPSISRDSWEEASTKGSQEFARGGLEISGGFLSKVFVSGSPDKQGICDKAWDPSSFGILAVHFCFSLWLPVLQAYRGLAILEAPLLFPCTDQRLTAVSTLACSGRVVPSES